MEVNSYHRDDLLELQEREDAKFLYATLSALIKEINVEVCDIMTESLEDILSSKAVRENVHNISPYIYATGLLAFTGRPIDRDMLTKVLSSISMQPNDYLLDTIAAREIHNLTMYMYSLYFLLVTGKEVTDENLSKVVTALGQPKDDMAITRVLEIYKRRQEKGLPFVR